LRAGILTEAAGTGASVPKMQEVSRQKKVEVLLGYICSAELFEDHAGEGILWPRYKNHHSLKPACVGCDFAT
jgi:hypothetical protein